MGRTASQPSEKYQLDTNCCRNYRPGAAALEVVTVSPAGAGTYAYRQLRRASESLFGHFVTSLRQFVLTGLGVVVIIFICAWLWYRSRPQARGDAYKPVPASSIKSGSVSGDPCGTHGPVVQAWLTDDAGGNLYGVRCQDGTTVADVAQ